MRADPRTPETPHLRRGGHDRRATRIEEHQGSCAEIVQRYLALEATLRAANDAATWVSTLAHQRRVFRNYDLRKHAYGQIKDDYGLAAQAAQHVASQVQRLLAEAERAYVQGPTDRDPEWINKYDAAELGAHAGSCWRFLGEYARAAACAETAVASFSGRLPRATQLNQVNAAGAYLGMGELEQAVDYARASISAAKALNSARAVERLQKFADQLDPYSGSIMVRQFRDQLHTELAA